MSPSSKGPPGDFDKQGTVDRQQRLVAPHAPAFPAGQNDPGDPRDFFRRQLQPFRMAVDLVRVPPQITGQGNAGLFAEADGLIGGGGARGDQANAEGGRLADHLSGNPSRRHEELAPQVNSPKQGFTGDAVEGIVPADILSMEEPATAVADSTGVDTTMRPVACCPAGQFPHQLEDSWGRIAGGLGRIHPVG